MAEITSSMAGATLGTLPRPMRALFTCFLLTIGIGYVAALIYLFLVDVDPHRKMGMSKASGQKTGRPEKTGENRFTP